MMYFYNFKLLPYGEKFPCAVGKRPENATKNRFKTTFPCNTTLLVQFLSFRSWVFYYYAYIFLMHHIAACFITMFY